ncbi:ATP-binding protein, partial [Arthrospira platensis SPKY1]|nr:ATP-binding protein [Arthrospira platensis SPKY1]
FGKLNGYFTITITDDGKAYDPTLAAEPDIQLPAEDRGIGGLGIFLIRKMMDEVQYTRSEGKNILQLKKKLTHNL